MLTCRQASRLLSDQMDASLPVGERVGLRLHLMMCDGCRNFGRQMAQLRGFAQAYRGGAGAAAAPDDEQSPSDRGP